MATALIFQKGHQVISINMGKQSSCNLGESLLPFMSLAGYFQLALADMVKVNPPLSIYFTGYCTCSHDCSYLHIQVGQWGAIISGLCETVSVCVCVTEMKGPFSLLTSYLLFATVKKRRLQVT